jgi:hypothetical protein
MNDVDDATAEAVAKAQQLILEADQLLLLQRAANNKIQKDIKQPNEVNVESTDSTPD